MLQSNRIEPTDTDTRRDHQIEAPLNLLARSIASSLKIDHCAIEYTIASGSQGWAGSERSDMINEAACRNGTPGTDDVSELSRIGLLIRTPITLKSGSLIGRLWIADSRLRLLDPDDTDRLNDFARIAGEMIYQQSRISRLLDAESMSRTGIWTWRLANGRFFGSSQFFDILGIGGCRDGMSPSAILKSIRDDQRRAVMDMFKTAVETGEPASLELHLKGCRATHAFASMRIDVDFKGRLIGAFGTLQDLTDRRQVEKLDNHNKHLEDALRGAQELADQQRTFVSMISHEFRTPLAIIDGNAHRLLKRSTTVPERWSHGISKIRNSVTRLTELIESLLTSSRLESGKIEFDPATMSLHELLEALTRNCSELYPKHEILLDLDRLPTPIDGDRDLLRHVFSNIFSNAAKYSPPESRIWVTGWVEEDGGIVVAVRDEGPGIAKDEQGSLFDRFFRASTSIGIAGSGNGLHHASELIRIHGGRIELESQEGEGSTFSVHIPKITTGIER